MRSRSTKVLCRHELDRAPRPVSSQPAVDFISNRGTTPTVWLRESFRDGARVCKRVLANSEPPNRECSENSMR